MTERSEILVSLEDLHEKMDFVLAALGVELPRRGPEPAGRPGACGAAGPAGDGMNEPLTTSAVDLDQARPGDLVLCSNTGLVARAIKIGQRLRVPKAFCGWNHVAVLTEKDADGWWVVEAAGHGVERNPLDSPGRHEFTVVDSGVDEAHRAQVVAFATAQVGDRYGWLTIASIVLDLWTPARVDLRRDGTWICSALAARAVEHGGRLYDDVSPFEIMPAQVARRYGVRSSA